MINIPPTPDGKKLLSYRAAAKVLGLSEKQTKELVVKHQLKPVHLGGEMIRFRQCDVECCRRRLQEHAEIAEGKTALEKSGRIHVTHRERARL
jgi:hypothetical protein